MTCIKVFVCLFSLLFHIIIAITTAHSSIIPLCTQYPLCNHAPRDWKTVDEVRSLLAELHIDES